MTRIAVIDTGTNSTRLLVADAEPGSIHEVVRQTVITRLGQGVDAGGRLAAPARERVTQCVAGYAAVIGELGARRGLIIATSSIRDAADGDVFISALARQFAFDYRLLSGDEEAQLSFAGAAIDLDGRTRAMLFDVGGGSTEIVTGVREKIDFAISMNLGCVRLREKFLHSDPTPAQELGAAAAFIDAELSRSLDMSRLPGWDRTLGVAGTVTALAAIDLGLDVYDREEVHGHVLSRERVEQLLKMLARMTLAERLNLPTIEPGRADVIVAGALIVWRLMLHAGIEAFSVSEYDILDGTALAMADGRL